MYQISHHHLSDTHYLTDLTSLFIRHMLHFARSIPITIYTLSWRAPTHHYLHAFLCLHTHCTHHLRVAQIPTHPTTSMWMATCTIFGKNALPYRRKHHNMQTLSAVSCQLSAVVQFAHRATPLGRLLGSKNSNFCMLLVLLRLLPPLLLLLIPSLCTTHTHHRPCSTTTYIRHPLCIRSAGINTLFLRSYTTIYQTHAPFQGLHSHHCLHAFRVRPRIALFARFSMIVHTLHTPLKSGSNCVGHPTTSMWMATYTHLAPKTLDQWRKHHNMQTLSAVSCQPSAVSCRSFRTRGHAFGAFPTFQKHHYLHGFCTTDTTSATTTTTHPITLYHIHTPSSRFHHHMHQTPATYQVR